MIYRTTSDYRYIWGKGTEQEYRLLEAQFNKIPAYMYLPSFTGIPKPEVFVHRFRKIDGTELIWFNSGLYAEIMSFMPGQDDTGDSYKYAAKDLTYDTFAKWVKSLDISLEARDYQIEAAWTILRYRQSLSEIATRGGKTFIFYLVARWMLEKGGAHNILMIVPSTQLVRQGISDFAEYGLAFETDSVWANGELKDGSSVTIGTFQSLRSYLEPRRKGKNGWEANPKYNPTFFDRYDVLCVDEAHHLVCKSIDNIIKQEFMLNCKLRFGFTGTLPEENTIESLCCHSLMGPTVQKIKTQDLVKEGFVTNAHIHQLYISYSPADYLPIYKEVLESMLCKDGSVPMIIKSLKEANAPLESYVSQLSDMLSGTQKLSLEQNAIMQLEKHQQVIDNVIDENPGNCIVFGHHVQYLKDMEKHLQERFKGKREVRLINGSTPSKKRDAIIAEMLNRSDIVLVASYGCVGTGITFKNITYAIFAESFKSAIINKQSIGRGLLLAEGKDAFHVWDLIDCLPGKRIERQGKAKKKIYDESEFITDSKRV